jgi:hypothetical protein
MLRLMLAWEHGLRKPCREDLEGIKASKGNLLKAQRRLSVTLLLARKSLWVPQSMLETGMLLNSKLGRVDLQAMSLHTFKKLS